MRLTEEAAEEIGKLSLDEFWSAYEDVVREDGEEIALAMLLERGRTDVEVFAYAFFPHYCQHDFNKCHRDWFETWRKPRKKVRLADAAPRGSAKSTIKALVKPIHDLCYGLEKFIVIVSNTASQSAGRLKDIRSELLENDDLIDCFGPFFDAKKVAETQYIARSGDHRCMFAGYGSGTEIRGIRFGEARPSKIILDDAEHSEEVENEETRTKVENWFTQVISKLGDENTKIEVIGTILHRQSLLAGLLENPAYIGSKYKAIESWSEREDLWEQWRAIYNDLDNEDRLNEALDFYTLHKEDMLQGTKILWPERESYLDLMEEIIEIGQRAFSKERQNEPAAPDDALFDDVGWYREVEGGFLIEDTGKIVSRETLLPETLGVIDPATGQTKPKRGRKGDFTCILAGHVDAKGRLFVHEDRTKRAKPTDYINWIFDLNDVWDFDVFGVETNLYRELLLPNIERERKDREKVKRKEFEAWEKERAKLREKGIDDPGPLPWGIQVAFKDIEQTQNKNKRIFTLEPKIKNRYILLNRNLSAEFKGQLEAFPDPTSHDDGPDALEMLWSIASRRYGMGSVRLRHMRGR